MAKDQEKPKTEIQTRPTENKLAAWEAQLLDQAKKERATERTGLPRISHQGGRLAIDGKDVQGGTLPVIVVAYSHGKEFYKGAFVPGKPATPVCFAFGYEEKGMKPHEEVPEKQSETCAGCEWNRFGTAELGEGKRCKDIRRVLVIAPTEQPGEIANTQVRQISIPPASLKNWGAYLKGLNQIVPQYGGNIRTVITEIGTERYKAAYALTFKYRGTLPKEIIGEVIARGPFLEPDLFAPYPVISEEVDVEAIKQSTKY